MIASTSRRIVLVALALVCLSETASRFQGIGARSSSTWADDAPTTTTTMTTTGAPSDNLEDPSNAVATSGEVPDDYCFRCSDKVTVAENLIALHTNLLAKKKALIRKNKAAAAAAAAAASTTSQKHVRTTPTDESASFNNPNDNDRSSSSANNNNDRPTTNRRPIAAIRNRTLEYPPQAPSSASSSSMSVISRLLVVRSATLTEQPPTIISDTTTNNQKNKLGRNKKGPALSLDRLQHELDHQWNATCDALLEVRICVRELAPTCIGDLQFHSLETWSYQELSKFSCPIEKGSRVKPWPGLNTRYYNYLDQPVPVARPVTSPEAIRERLGQMFPNGAIRPPGVVLRPTVNNQNFISPSASNNLIVAGSSSSSSSSGPNHYYNPNADRRRLFNTIVTWGVFVFAAFVSVATIFIFISRATNREEIGLEKK